MPITVTGLGHAYAREAPVLADIALAIPDGQVTGLLGPSGSGKTTLIRIMTGLLRPSRGAVRVACPDGSPARPADLGYMGQSDALYLDLTGEQNLRFFAGLYGLKGKRLAERVEAVLELTRLDAHAAKPVRHYSGGMKKRLSLAVALVHEPRFLFLDEPTVGIDPVLRAEFWDEFARLAAEGRTLVVSTHVMDEAERCDRLALLFEGALLRAGTPAEVRAGAPSVEAAFLALRRSAPAASAAQGAEA